MGEVAGDWREQENGDSEHKELPQGEHRDIVLRGGREEGARQEIDLRGERTSSGSKSCRGASAGRLFCVREDMNGGGRSLF